MQVVIRKLNNLHKKNSVDVINAFERIYNRSKLVWPKTLQVDRGREFMGAVTVAFEEKGCLIRRGIPNLHRNQAVEARSI